MISVLFAIIAAALTHLAVRYAAGAKRGALFLGALIFLGVAFYLGGSLGGFWPGVYTLLSAYFLACIITPWLELFIRHRRAD